MPGLEPGTSRLSMLSECTYHLRYIPVDPSAHTHSISHKVPTVQGAYFSTSFLIWLKKIFEQNFGSYFKVPYINNILIVPYRVREIFSKWHWTNVYHRNFTKIYMTSTYIFFIRGRIFSRVSKISAPNIQKTSLNWKKPEVFQKFEE